METLMRSDVYKVSGCIYNARNYDPIDCVLSHDVVGIMEQFLVAFLGLLECGLQAPRIVVRIDDCGNKAAAERYLINKVGKLSR